MFHRGDIKRVIWLTVTGSVNITATGENYKQLWFSENINSLFPVGGKLYHPMFLSFGNVATVLLMDENNLELFPDRLSFN